MEQLRADLELKKLRGNADAPDQRRNLRLEIETLKKNLDSNSVHLVALKYQLSKTQVTFNHNTQIVNQNMHGRRGEKISTGPQNCFHLIKNCNSNLIQNDNQCDVRDS